MTDQADSSVDIRTMAALYESYCHRRERPGPNDEPDLRVDALLVQIIAAQALALAAFRRLNILDQDTIGRLVYDVVDYPDIGLDIVEQAERRVARLISPRQR